MGNAFASHGKVKDAVEAYNRAILLDPNCEEAYYNFGSVLQGGLFNKPNKDLQKTIFSLLDKEKYVRPIDISKAAISLLKLEPNLKKHLHPVNTEKIENPLDVISDLIKLPLLLKLMCVCPLPDLELENLLKIFLGYLLFHSIEYQLYLNLHRLFLRNPQDNSLTDTH